MIGLTNDERCLIRSLSVEKHCQGFRNNYEIVFKYMITFKLRITNSKC